MTGTSDGVEKACHDIESYIVLCTVTAMDSVALTPSMVSGGGRLKMTDKEKMRDWNLMAWKMTGKVIEVGKMTDWKIVDKL